MTTAKSGTEHAHTFRFYAHRCSKVGKPGTLLGGDKLEVTEKCNICGTLRVYTFKERADVAIQTITNKANAIL